jgi:hypothetical protein
MAVLEPWIDSEDRISRPASVYCPKKRTVAIASKETGTHYRPVAQIAQ